MTEAPSTFVLQFAHSRAKSGEDIAALVGPALPEGTEITADLDARGAVAGYTLTFHLADADAVAEASFRVRDFLMAVGIPFEIGGAC